MQAYTYIKRMYLLVIWQKNPPKQTKHPHWSTCSTSFCRTLSIIEAFYICWLKHLVSCLCSRNSWERLTPTHTWCAAVKLKRVRAKERKQSASVGCFLFIRQGHRNAQARESQCVDNKMGNVGESQIYIWVFKSHVYYMCTHKYAQRLIKQTFSFEMKFQMCTCDAMRITVELDLTFSPLCTHCIKCSLTSWFIAKITNKSIISKITKSSGLVSHLHQDVHILTLN